SCRQSFTFRSFLFYTSLLDWVLPMDSCHRKAKSSKERVLMFAKTAKGIALVSLIGATLAATPVFAQSDWGQQVQDLLDSHSEQQFGVVQPLSQSALGPYSGMNNALSVIAAKGVKVSVVSNATDPLAD